MTRRRFDPRRSTRRCSWPLVAAFVAVPLLATVLGGFKSPRRTAHQSVRPAAESGNGRTTGGILFSKRYWQLLRNSLIIAALSTLS